MASLPAGYEGEFGPHVQSLVITLYYAANMSESKVLELLSHMGISILDGQVSNILTKKNEQWHAEKDEIYRAGLNSSRWQHLDDTGTRVDGENHYCHIMGNPLYTAYFTRPRKDRLTIIEVLQNLSQAQVLLNSQTKQWLDVFDVPKWARRLIEKWPQHEWLTYEQIEERVESDLSRLNKQQKARVLEAAALTAHHAQTTMPVLKVLMSDDAPQFKWLAEDQALCWIHDGRHYNSYYVTIHSPKVPGTYKRVCYSSRLGNEVPGT
ncbi:MAG: transposase [Chloroflexi bacterium]|nr:transposase [Chloroflexota bacterium]